MIELPRHVRSVTNKTGRKYLYYQKFRNSDHQWPAVELPADPFSAEFALRRVMLDRLDAVKTDDQWKWTFADETGRKHALPSPRDSADAFWAACDKAEAIGKALAAGERKTFSALIVEFKESAAYQVNVGPDGKRRPGLAKSTQEQYLRHLNDIDAAWGADPVASLSPVDAQKAIDAFKETPSAGRVFRAVLSRLISWGIPRGYSLTNPVENTETPDEDGTYEPWQPWMFEFFFEHARIGLHMPVYSGLFTGQRISDVLKMKRPKEGVTEMPLIAQKTGEIVPVQIHSEYRQIIRSLKSEHDMLHLREDGEPWTYEGFKTAWQRELNRKVFARFREERVVFHGTRKNAVNNLLEVGCSDALVAAIVKMSPAMVHHYSKRVSQFRLAREAMQKLEAGWEQLRPNVLGKVGKSA